MASSFISYRIYNDTGHDVYKDTYIFNIENVIKVLTKKHRWIIRNVCFSK